MDVYVVDDRVVVLNEAEQRSVNLAVRDLNMDLESAVRLAADMQDDAPDEDR